MGKCGSSGFGLYVHIPFCTSKCYYCAFSVSHNGLDLQGEYFKALGAEVRHYLANGPFLLGEGGFDTVYFGGGTPSLVEPSLLGNFLASIPVAIGAEVSVEVNPESARKDLFTSYLDFGVTRVSIGVQSFDDRVLRYFGRNHDSYGAEKAIGLAADTEGLSVGIDLVYGSEAEDDESWESTVSKVSSLAPRVSHVSAYALGIEPRTKLHHLRASSQSEDVLAARYLMADEAFEGCELTNYEVSNWSLPDRHCLHNTNYWNWGDYLGVGLGAHSHFGRLRWWNEPSLKGYIAAVKLNGSGFKGGEELEDSQIATERLMLALRTKNGLSADELRILTSRYENEKLLELFEIEGGRASLRPTGRLLADGVFRALSN